MKRYIKSTSATLEELSQDINPDNIIHITMYLHPTIFADSQVVTAAISYDENNKRYHTDVNPSRVINGPLPEYGEELETPIRQEYDAFIEDCVELVDMFGFTIIARNRSEDSGKSEYLLLFGMKDKPCGLIVYDLRLSDHPFDATFPEEFKEKAMEYLTMNKILDDSASRAGINFEVEKVTIGAVNNDTWDKALNRLFLRLKRMRNKIQQKQKTDGRYNN